jgi:hypothetical protein
MESLFRLVKAMEKSEKRYFSIYVSRHNADGNTHDSAIFHAIDKLDNPSDELLRATIANPKILANLSVYKHLLYKNLLKCLNAYHSGRNAEDEILELYKSSKILYDKCLYQESKKMAEKAKGIALQNECFSLYNMLFEAENIYHERHFIANDYEEKILNKFSDNQNMLELQHNLEKYNEIDGKLFFHSKKWGINDKSLNAEHLPQLPYEELVHDKINALSDKAKIKFFRINSLLLYKDGKYEESILLERESQSILHAKPDSYPYKWQSILVSLERMIWCYYMSQNFKKVEEIIEQVNDIPDSSTNIKLIKFQMFTNIELMNKINSGDTYKMHELESRIKKFYKDFDYAISIQKQLIINFNLSLLFFIGEDYTKCTFWLNSILDNVSKKVDLDIIISAKLMNIVLQYEQKMHTLLRYTVIATKRFIKRKRALNAFEQLFFSTIGKLSDYSGDDTEILTHYYKTYYQMVLNNEPVDRSFSHYQWAISRAQKKSMAQVIKEVNEK